MSPSQPRPARPIRRDGPTRATRLLAVAVATTGLLAAPLAATGSAAADEQSRAGGAARQQTVIAVDAAKRRTRMAPALLGINHRFPKNGYGLWDVRGTATDRDDRPHPTAVRHIRRAGVQSLRYPGGTTAAMYKWKDAIGPSAGRACQIEGHGNRVDGFKGHDDRLAYGPDEFMEVVEATGAAPLIMMPFVNQSPQDAADWVEYMNDPVGGKNPGGGINWADRRAKAGGHPRPYDVQRWEVGNESHVAPFRYDFAVGVSKQVEQYAEGGVRTIGGESTNTEKLGRDCAHPGDGKPATGRRYQEFETLYTPVHRVDAVRVGERTRPWRQVSQQQLSHPVRNDLEGKRVFAVDKVAGRIIFGTVEPILTADQRPVVPAEGDIVTADYTNRFQGFFAFARAMHAVDPDIKVCATWGTPLFAQQYGRRDYDCSSAHPLTNFSKAPAREWAGPLEGHDRMMLGLAERRADVRALQAAQPDRTPLWLTEFQAIHGYGRAFPGWSASVSNAVYMSAQWATWLEMGIPWGNGGDLLGRGVGSVFGQPNGNFVFSAEAHARETISPMFQAGGQVVASSVKRNPQREPQLRNAGAYGALTVVASRGRRGELYLLVVNKLPTKDVKTTVRMAGFRARGTATVRRVAGKSFQQFNKPGKPATVAMQRSERRVQRDSFTATFPAHSVTVVRMPRR